MYTSFCQWRDRPRTPTAESLTYHDRPYHRFLGEYHKLEESEVTPGAEIPADIRRLLPQYISHPNNLRIAWDYLAEQGGQAPGPNGHRYRDYSDNEAWGLLRAVSKALRSGRYRAGRERKVQIPKSSGNGTRTLYLANIEDRVVQRGMLQILQPLLDPAFSELSFGYRPGRDRRHALAMAQHLAQGQGLWTWIVDDIQNCYDQIPCQRLLQVLRTRLPGDVVDLIRLTNTADRKRVRPGAPLSALLVNTYLDHVLDRPWLREHPEAPLLRTADDVLVLAAAPEQAHELYGDLAHRLRSAGLPLKGDPRTAIRDLARGDEATWLGFSVGAGDGGLSVALAERSWQKLAAALDRAHEKPLAALVAEDTVAGWLLQAAPCHATTPLSELIGRVCDLARDYGFEELPADRGFEKQWADAVEAWQRIEVAPPELAGVAGDAGVEWEWSPGDEALF